MGVCLDALKDPWMYLWSGGQNVKNRRRFRRRCSSFLGVNLVLLCWALFTHRAVADDFGFCYESIQDANENGSNDSALDVTEYLDVVKKITHGALTTLSATLLGVFDTLKNAEGVIPISVSIGFDPEGDALLDELCDSTFAGVLASIGQIPDYDECRTRMFFADASPQNNKLEKQREFPHFANLMTETNLYSEDANFNTIPEPVQRVFEDFKDTSGVEGIDVTDAWKGPDQSISQFQLRRLNNICRQVLVAIHAGKALSVDDALGVEFSFDQCAANMILADTEPPNNILLVDEYVVFLNGLTGDTFSGRSFDSLPSLLKQNYVVKATTDGTDGISIEGSRPGSSGESVLALEEFCSATEDALNGGSATDSFQMSFSDCTIAMATSEIDSRSNALDREEYVLFVNKATNFEYFRDDDFDDLPQPLVDNYNALAPDSNGIPIDGSFPGLPRSSEQNTTLSVICTATAAAIQKAINPGPTVSPTPSPNESIVTVYNAFVVSNNDSLLLSDILSGDENTGLNEGYNDFVASVTGELVVRGRRLLSERDNMERFLSATGVVNGTPTLYEFQNYDCPATVTSEGAICHVVYGSFNATFVNEANISAMQQTLTEATQTAVNRTVNGLQSFIVSAYPDTKLVVVGVPEDGRVQPEGTAGIRSGGSSEGDDDDGVNVGVVIGILLAVFVICCCLCGFLIWQYQSDGGILPGKGTLSFAPRGEESSKAFDLDSGEEKPDPEIGESGADFSIQEQSMRGASQRRFSVGEPKESTGIFPFGRGRRNSNEVSNEIGSLYAGNDAELNNSRAAGLDYNHGDENSVMAENSQQSQKSGKPNNGIPHNVIPGQGIWDIAEDTEETEEGGDDENEEEDDESSEEEEEVEIVEYFEDEEEEDETEVEEIIEDDDEDDEDEDDGDEDDNEELGSRADQTYVTAALPGNIKNFNNMVETGDWDGVVEAAKNFDNPGDDADSYAGGRISTSLGPGDSDEESEGEETDEDEEEEEEDDDDEEEEDEDDESVSLGNNSKKTEEESTAHQSATTNSYSFTSEELQTREMYQKKVEELVRLVAPDETENVATMMDQFAGREEELINTLETMYERSYSVRARNAIHKSKPGVPTSSLNRSGRSRSASTSSAAVAAASTILGRPPDASNSRSDREPDVLDSILHTDGDETHDEDILDNGPDDEDSSSDEEDGGTGAQGDEGDDAVEGSESYDDDIVDDDDIEYDDDDYEEEDDGGGDEDYIDDDEESESEYDESYDDDEQFEDETERD